jgi:DNA-binding LytR/AlgR family response regulator
VASFLRTSLLSLFLAVAGVAHAQVAAAVGGDIKTVSICKPAAEQSAGRCSDGPLWAVNSQDGLVRIETSVRIDRQPREPLAVFIKAFAASAVYWDGRLIGRNGMPADSAAVEVPGFRDAVVAIPSGLSGAGVHRLEIEMSSMQAPVRLASPVLDLRVAPFEEPLQPALRNYLPALVTVGGMLVVILCLLLLAWKQRRGTGLSYLIAAALCAGAQLAAETSRAFVQLLYPAQVLRLELVLLCSCGFGLLLPAYLARGYNSGQRKLMVVAQAGLILPAVLLLRAWDEKIAWVILSSAALSAAICAAAIREKKADAIPPFLMLGACLALGLWARASFLDRDFYIWALLFLATLLLQEARRLEQPAETVGKEDAEPAPLWLGSGPTRHLVPSTRIVRLAAADDYTEVFIERGPAVLHPEPLHALLERLPHAFVRVHRSHAVNLAHLESFRRGSRSSVTMSDTSVVPVSRRCIPKLIAALSA